jgi:hypothetical protein
VTDRRSRRPLAFLRCLASSIMRLRSSCCNLTSSSRSVSPTRHSLWMLSHPRSMSRLVSLALLRRRGVAAVSASAGIASAEADVVDGHNSSPIGRNAAGKLADDLDDAASSQDLMRLGSVCSLRAGVAAGRPRTVADGRIAAADDEDDEEDDDDEENRSRASSASNRAHSAAVLGVGRNRCWTYLAWIQAVSSLVDKKEKTKKKKDKVRQPQRSECWRRRTRTKSAGWACARGTARRSRGCHSPSHYRAS